MARFITLDQSFCGFDRVRSIGSQTRMPAVVQEDYVSLGTVSVDTLPRMTLDRIGGRFSPVKTGDVPHHRLESQLVRHIQHGGTPCAKRRAKETCLNAGCIGDRLGAVGEFPQDLGA